ncbi:MAG: hypothetical protein PHV75_07290 [Victivallaceae bacterium]|nr:hypothetical protein [Victivallaceae bacterium]MDD3704214.1 hypothetical protein [Victivallaceae bacterium]MDD4318307.1 hypothetical protein [Victivallaceae bacterium]MDD5664141.1 hypothetical protein [Victivallaceae bacterium]
MNVNVIDVGAPDTMQPLTCGRKLIDIPVAGVSIGNHLRWFFGDSSSNTSGELSIRADLWPSSELALRIRRFSENMVVCNPEGIEMLRLTVNDSNTWEEIALDATSLHLRYPWDILAMCEQVVANIEKNRFDGTVREGVTIDGVLWVGRGSVILPGVYIEGKVIIGENCKIGPNCYLRGNTYIGDNCHVGQAVEIKNSMLMNKVSAGHLSYLGDSIVAENTNLGAGTITANLRHDGKNHRSSVNGMLVDSGRRKFGTVIGECVHTGIHTTIYPGRKLWPGISTVPGEIVTKDIVSDLV